MDEVQKTVSSGWAVLPVVLASWSAIPVTFAAGVLGESPTLIVVAVLLIPVALLLTKGLFTLQPNEARVLVLFGNYIGTVKEDGFHWANPFAVNRGPWVTTQDPGHEGRVSTKNKYRVSLRARNFETATLKVNDQRGNPIEIGAVVVWRRHRQSNVRC